MLRIKLASILPANDGKHKYKVMLLVRRPSGWRLRTVLFGAKNMMDFTLYNDRDGREVADAHRDRYIARHSQAGEDWKDPLTAGFWSRWILWEEPTVGEAIDALLTKHPSWRIDAL